MAAGTGVVRFRRDGLNSMVQAINEAIAVAFMAKKTRSSTFARLRWKSARMPRRTPGTFRFPFGCVRYVDVQSLMGQYSDIFIKRIYDVSGLGDAPCIVDCGGNVGLSVIWFKQRYPHSKVIVFEADPIIADVLAANVRNLRLEAVEVVQAAVGATTGPVTFQADGADGGRIDTGTGLTVGSVRLSDRIDQPVDILKIDIEGSEYAVINDLCHSGKIGLIRNIICELHGYDATQAQMGALWNNLSNAGFRMTVASGGTAEWMPGPPDSTPFPAARSAKFLLQMHAWRPEMCGRHGKP